MVHVVAVHGIFQEQRGAHQLLTAWEQALLDGLEVAGGSSSPALEMSMAYYGRLFLSEEDQGRQATKGAASEGTVEGLSWVDRIDFDPGEEGFLTAAVEELPATKTGVEDKGGLPAFVRPLTRRIAQRVDGQLVLVLVPVLRQVRQYLTEDEVAAEARAAVEHAVGEGCDVLIGHSLGSVIAFETLALRPDLHVDTLVTLGSPLSMRTVASRLRAGAAGHGWALPGAVRRWVNVYDEGDPVAAAGRVGRMWNAAEDYSVGNGASPHDVTAYLGKRITGQAVLEGSRR